MGFKEKLKSELQYNDMTVKELAALSRIKKQTIDNYLSTHNSLPSADVAVKIAKVLNVSVEYLFSDLEESHSPNEASALKYAPKIRQLADIIQNMNPQELNIVTSVVKAIQDNRSV